MYAHNIGDDKYNLSLINHKIDDNKKEYNEIYNNILSSKLYSSESEVFSVEKYRVYRFTYNAKMAITRLVEDSEDIICEIEKNGNTCTRTQVTEIKSNISNLKEMFYKLVKMERKIDLEDSLNFI